MSEMSPENEPQDGVRRMTEAGGIAYVLLRLENLDGTQIIAELSWDIHPDLTEQTREDVKEALVTMLRRSADTVEAADLSQQHQEEPDA